MNCRHITDLLIKFQNKSIDTQKFNTNIFIDIALNSFYFNKESKKTLKLKETQNKILQAHFKKEALQEKEEKKLYNDVRQKKETVENAQKKIKQKKEELRNVLLKQKDITIYTEHTFDTYIPPKNYSLSLCFHLNNFKKFKKYHSKSGADITYKNPSLSNPQKDKIIIPYSEPPYIIDEDNDILINNQNETEKNEIIEKMKEENKNELKKIINYEEDDILFYSEKLEKEQDIKKSSKWLNDINDEEIDTNFNNMIEYRKDNKSLDNNNYFYYDLNYSISEYVTESIFDDIPQGGGNMYSKFSLYLSEKSFKTYMKKMNYNYIDLMLLTFFDLESEFSKFNLVEKEQIVLYFIKKMILSCGICNSKLYELLVRAIASKKGNFNFENYIECFTPIFEASEKYQTLKYKLLLFLVINQNNKTLSMENYKVFCNLIKGKWVYDEQTFLKLSKKMIKHFKEKYPKDYTDNFKYYKICSIVEDLIDNEYLQK